jgi:hypothetical protein
MGAAVAAYTYQLSDEWRGEHLDREGQPLTCAAGNLFTARGVGPGDAVYVIVLLKGEVFLVGRLAVARVWDRAAWDAEPGRPPVWEGAEVSEGAGTPMRLTRPVPPHVIGRLVLGDRKGRVRRLTVTAGMVDTPQSLKGVRRLSTASAELLEGLLEVRV